MKKLCLGVVLVSACATGTDDESGSASDIGLFTARSDICPPVWTSVPTGRGTALSPYIICNTSQWTWFGGKTGYARLAVHLDGQSLSPIFLRGHLDGADYEVIAPVQPLFTAIDVGASVSRLAVWNSTVYDTGGLVKGNNAGRIEDVLFHSIYLNSYSGVGGLAYRNVGVIERCEVWLDAATGTGNAGGIAAINMGVIETSSVFANEVLGFGGYAGGLVGENDGVIAESYAISNETSGRETGGLVGRNLGWIYNSYAQGGVRAVWNGTSWGGGVVGLNGGEIYRTYAVIRVVEGSTPVAGIAGANYYLVADSYSLDLDGYACDGVEPVPSDLNWGVVSDCDCPNIAGMMDQDTYEDWDFENTWRMGFYPCLWWQDVC